LYDESLLYIVGSVVGLDVGLDVGHRVGHRVGLDVGLDVGHRVGLDVGEMFKMFRPTTTTIQEDTGRYENTEEDTLRQNNKNI